MDALTKLEDQHKIMRNLLRLFTSERGIARGETASKLVNWFNLHTTLEESWVFPIMEQYEALRDEVCDFWDEHIEIKKMLENLSDMNLDSPEATEEIEKISEFLTNHIRHEEDEIFREARKIMASADMKEMEEKLEGALQARKAAA